MQKSIIRFSNANSHNKSSNYEGISWSKPNQKWKSNLSYKGIRYELGYHSTEVEAVKARDRKVMSLGMPTSKLQYYKPAK